MERKRGEGYWSQDVRTLSSDPSAHPHNLGPSLDDGKVLSEEGTKIIEKSFMFYLSPSVWNLNESALLFSHWLYLLTFW